MKADISRREIGRMITGNKIIAIVRRIPSDKIAMLASALYDGGIRLIEVTFDNSDIAAAKETERAIEILAGEFSGKMRVGAGTVLNAGQVKCAAGAGAEFIISPNVNEEVIKASKDAGMVSIPGALTPTEIERAYAAGGDFIKLFPADSLGLSYMKALEGPLGHIPLIAVGGVDEKNISDFLRAGFVAAGVGSGIVKADLINSGDFEAVTMLAQKYTEAVKGF